MQTARTLSIAFCTYLYKCFWFSLTAMPILRFDFFKMSLAMYSQLKDCLSHKQ